MILAMVSLSLLVAFPAGAAMDEDWTELAVGDLSWAEMARSGDDLYVVWMDWTTESLLFLRHDGNSTPIVISSGSGFPSYQRVFAHERYVHVAWVENETLWMRTSGDRGASFGPAVAVSGPFPGGPMDIAWSSGRLHVAWTWSDDDEIGGVAVATSQNRGSSFSAPIRLDGAMGHGDARIAAHGNGVHVFWDDSWRNDDPMARIRSSRDHGGSFGPLTILSPDSSDWPEAFVGSAHAHANRVVVHWEQRDWIFGGARWRTHYFARSLDRGGSFGSTILATGGDLELGPGRLAASKDHLAFVWELRDSPDYFSPSELFLRESFDGGQTFGPAVDLSQSPATWSMLLGVDVEGKKTHVIWREALPAPGGFQWFRGMTIENGVPGPFVHLMDDTTDVEVSAFSAVDGHIDILALEWTPSGYRLLHRHGVGSMH
jgi:hypothetical protein